MPTPYAGINNFPATIPLADDTDPPNASVFQPPQEGLSDRTVWLKTRVGLQFDVFDSPGAIDDPTFANWASWNHLAPFTPDVDGFLLAAIPIARFASGDALYVNLTSTLAFAATDGAAEGVVRLFYKGVNGFTTYQPFPGALTQLTSNGTGPFVQTFAAPLSLSGMLLISSLTSSTLNIAIAGYISSTPAGTSVGVMGSRGFDFRNVRNT